MGGSSQHRASVHPAWQTHQNAYIEHFNLTHRAEMLDRYIFNTLTEVRTMIEDWQARYNREWPHTALGDIPPIQYNVTQ